MCGEYGEVEEAISIWETTWVAEESRHLLAFEKKYPGLFEQALLLLAWNRSVHEGDRW